MSNLKLASTRAPASLPTPPPARCAHPLLQLARRHNLRLPNSHPLLQRRTVGRGHFAHRPMRSLIDQHRQQVAQFLSAVPASRSACRESPLFAAPGPPDSERIRATPALPSQVATKSANCRSIAAVSRWPMSPHRETREHSGRQMQPFSSVLPWRHRLRTVLSMRDRSPASNQLLRGLLNRPDPLQSAATRAVPAPRPLRFPARRLQQCGRSLLRCWP